MNAYSAETIFIDEEKNINTGTYDGLGGTDTVFMTNVGDALFITDGIGNVTLTNIERILAGNGGDVIQLSSTTILVGDLTIDGGHANDIIWSNAGNDVINGAQGDDILDGGPGVDTIHGGLGTDRLGGGDDNDVLHFTFNASTIDFVYGAGATIVNATTGEIVDVAGKNGSSDTFDGGAGVDSLQMAASDDVINLRDISVRLSNIEQINAGAGNDVVNLTDGSTIYGNVAIYGESGNDVIWSSGGSDFLDGGIDNDTIWGGGGDDTIAGGVGADELNGGEDTDTAVFTGLASEWSIVIVGPGEFTVTNLADPTDVDHLKNIELAEFDDTTIDLSVCGNNVIEGTEQCDDGNSVNGDCCSSSCQFEANTTVCRASAGVCDIAETCTGSSATCPAETFESPSTECRAAVGECDVAEHCSGVSAACPSDSVKPSDTTCTDDGNVCSADICNGSSTECQHPAGNPGAVCRASTGACDVAETCTGDNLSCPADTGAPDSDNDGQCDAVDLCTNGAPVISGKLILANFATGNGDDTLNFSGTLAFTTLPALDPIANGVRVRLEDADEALFDVTVPGGAYNTITKTGWKLNTPGTQWKFSSPIAVGGAITQVTLTKKTPQIKFVVKGKKGAFAALPVTAPVTTTLVLTPPLGLTGACSDVSFSGAQCAFNAGQKTLTCQR